jgi:hypothetical protein
MMRRRLRKTISPLLPLQTALKDLLQQLMTTRGRRKKRGLRRRRMRMWRSCTGANFKSLRML